MRYGIPAIFVLLTTMCNAQPIRLLCNLDEAQRPVPLSLDLSLNKLVSEAFKKSNPLDLCPTNSSYGQKSCSITSVQTTVLFRLNPSCSTD